MILITKFESSLFDALDHSYPERFDDDHVPPFAPLRLLKTSHCPQWLPVVFRRQLLSQ